MHGIARQLFTDRSIRYLLYLPKRLDSSHPYYDIRERLLNLQHAIGCNWAELASMLACSPACLHKVISANARWVLSFDNERALRRLEALFAEEIAHYLRDPKVRDRYYYRYKPTPVRQEYGGYKLVFHAQRNRGFTVKPYKLSDIQTVEDLEALRRNKRTVWKASTPTERRLKRLDSLAVSEATCGGFEEIIESGNHYGADYEVEPGQSVPSLVSV